MAKLIFVNLPVADVARSTAFYEAIGATLNPMFSNAATSCMVFSDTIHVMLLNHERFVDFTSKAIADSATTTEMLLCLSEDSRAAVDRTADAAIAAGSRDFRDPQDYGFMYGRSFEDPDGHVIEVMWMDVEAARAAMAQTPAA